MGPISRRTLLAYGTVGASSAVAGCASLGSDPAAVDGTVENRTTTAVTVTVELIRPDGAVDFGREYDLESGDAVDFSFGDPAPEYTLRTDVQSGGPTKTETWDTRECQRVVVGLDDGEITYEFGDC